MHPLQRSETFFNKLRNDRFAARTLLSDEQRQFYDQRLTFLVEQAVSNNQKPPITSISKLLNKGAIVDFDPHELSSANLADVLDVLQYETPRTRVHYILTLLEPIVSSACDAWVTNRRCAGNGGIYIPQFLTAFVITGDVWGNCTENTAIQIHHRYHAWSVLRKMVWAYEHDRRIERFPLSCNRLVTRLLFDFLSYVSRKERATLDPAELKLFDTIVDFLRVRTTISRTFSYWFWWYPSPLSAELLLRIDPKLFKKWYAQHMSTINLNGFLCNHTFRKNTLKLLAYEGFRVHILQPDVVRDLCRRKERAIFEHLYRIDPQGLKNAVPFALQVLESKLVRGRKEKLIAFLKSIQDVP